MAGPLSGFPSNATGSGSDSSSRAASQSDNIAVQPKEVDADEREEAVQPSVTARVRIPIALRTVVSSEVHSVLIYSLWLAQFLLLMAGAETTDSRRPTSLRSRR